MKQKQLYSLFIIIALKWWFAPAVLGMPCGFTRHGCSFWSLYPQNPFFIHICSVVINMGKTSYLVKIMGPVLCQLITIILALIWRSVVCLEHWNQTRFEHTVFTQPSKEKNNGTTDHHSQRTDCLLELNVVEVQTNVVARDKWIKSVGWQRIDTKSVKRTADRTPQMLQIFKKNYNVWLLYQYQPWFTHASSAYWPGIEVVIVHFSRIIGPAFSKIYESLLNDQLIEYFYELFSVFLCAFRKNYSCQSLLVKMIDDWKIALDKNHGVGAVFMELSKAFDCPPHSLLIAKLHAYGFSIPATWAHGWLS